LYFNTKYWNKKIIGKKFEIVEVNEYNTSKLYNKTFKELENVKIRKKKHSKHLHEILTPKEKTERRIYVNRDRNACKNILLLTRIFLMSQTRPTEFVYIPKKKVIQEQIIKEKKSKKEIVV
jgi:hypothetical protein